VRKILDSTKLATRYWQCSDARNPQIVRSLWRPDTPSVLQIEATNHCNLKCVMCPRTTVMKRELEHMTVEVWEQALGTWSGRERTETFENLLTGNPFNIVIKGAVKPYFLGEMLMHPDLLSFIKIAQKWNLALQVQTNGVLLARRRIRKLLLDTPPAGGLSISIDGFSVESYETIRDGSRWQTLKNGIEAFLAERDAAGLAEEIPVQIVSILPDASEASRQKIEQFLKTIADGRLGISFIPLSAGHDTTFFDADGRVKHMDFAPTYRVTPERPSCDEPMNKMQILADGQISACCYDTDGHIKIGHVRDGVDQAWQSEPMRQLHLAHLRHQLADYDLCRQCLGVNADGTPAEPRRRHARAEPLERQPAVDADYLSGDVGGSGRE